MIPTQIEPIESNWTTLTAGATPDNDPIVGDEPPVTARQVSQQLARFEVADLDAALIPPLAAAAAEVASIAGITWRFSTDDAPVALLRVLARATMARPDAAGPHTGRLSRAITRHLATTSA